MPVFQGAFWISDQRHKRFLDVDPNGIVKGTTPSGPRGLDLLNSTLPRNQIWLIEAATDGKNFLIRNYETGTALDIKDQNSGNDAHVVVTSGSSRSQVWEIIWLGTHALGAVYQIKNTLTSTAINQNDGSTINNGQYIYPVTCYHPHGGSNQSWLIEPVLLPTLYSLTNLAAPTLVLRASDRPYASDDTSRGVALVPTELSARNQLWTFEYTSTGESIIRSASNNQFVLELTDQNSQQLIARKHHGGPSQRWKVRDENENNHIVSFANVNTDTLLATRKKRLWGGPSLDTLAAVIEGNTRWQIYPSPQPPFFWVTIQSSQTGAFLAQAEDGSIIPSAGALHAKDHAVQWRFIMLGNNLRYVIVNRATGFVLEHRSSVTFEVSVVAENHDRNKTSCHWILGSFGGNVRIVNVSSNCALNHYSGDPIQARLPEIDDPSYQWLIMPFYDTLPSFALVNSLTGRCIANNPNPGVGTVITTNDVNNFQSQWVFYHSIDQIESDPGYALLNKMSGNVLEYYRGTRIEAHDTSHSGHHQKWRLLPLPERLFALVNTDSHQLLCDPGQPGPMTDNSPSEYVRALSWQLISHRESGFDFISWDFDILQRLLPHIPSSSGQELQQVIARRLPAGEKKRKGEEKGACIPRAPRTTRTTNDALRAIFTRLIGQWEEDTIPETSQPRTIVSTNRKKVEEEWKIPLSERPLRRCSDEPEWIRIDLKGIRNINGSWLGNIRGLWLKAPVFQIIVPVGIHIGRVVIQRAMLQSLTEGLTVEIRATPSTHTSTDDKRWSPTAAHRPQGLGSDDGSANWLALLLDAIKIESLKHDEL